MNVCYLLCYVLTVPPLLTSASLQVLKFASPIIGAAALPLTVLERAAELDCPWLVVMDRAEQAGRLLAALLLENAEGE